MFERRQILIDTVLASISMLVSSTYIRGKSLLEHLESYPWSLVSKAFYNNLAFSKAINITPFIRMLIILTVRVTVRILRQGRKCTIKLSKPGMTVG